MYDESSSEESGSESADDSEESDASVPSPASASASAPARAPISAPAPAPVPAPAPAPATTGPSSGTFDIEFGTGGLGLILEEAGSHVLVKEALAGKTAAVGGAKAGDTLVRLNGSSIEGIGFQATLQLLKDAQRPMTIGFQHPDTPQACDVDWVVDCYDRHTGGWVVGVASQFMPQAHGPPKINVRIENNDGKVEYEGPLEMPPTYRGVRLVEAAVSSAATPHNMHSKLACITLIHHPASFPCFAL